MTTSGQPFASRYVSWIQRAAIGLAGLVLAATLMLVGLERTWASTAPPTPEDAFYSASTGTELMPLAVYQVLFDLFPDQFQPGGAAAGDWIDQFGLIRGTPERNQGLPMGFSISQHRPRSGAPSPVPFVGLNCSLCHTARVKVSDDDPGVVVLGMGTNALDFIAWVDAFKTSLLDEQRLTIATIDEKYRDKYHRGLTLAESATIQLWLGETRKTLKENLPKTDRPYSGAEVRNPDFMPNGPSRTQPFRNLVRNVLDLPAATDRAFCKIPTLYQQQDREWGQYDGSVHDRLTRSVLAAVAVGATYNNLTLEDISEGVERSIAFTTTLDGPSFAKLFPADYAKLDPGAIARGKAVYARHCDTCHGHPEGGHWVPGARQGEVVPVEEIGTDRERVSFRYMDTLPDSLVAYFPAKNPLRPKREDLRPGPLGHTAGYLSTPLHSAFSHAPFLHNGSVLTLAELINLQPRREVYYRGSNNYDPAAAGLVAPATPDAKRYYRFDTHRPGNSNAGHDFPWSFHGPGWDQAALEDLLAYLKTI
jgi:hypothetical protein